MKQFRPAESEPPRLRDLSACVDIFLRTFDSIASEVMRRISIRDVLMGTVSPRVIYVLLACARFRRL